MVSRVTLVAALSVGVAGMTSGCFGGRFLGLIGTGIAPPAWIIGYWKPQDSRTGATWEFMSDDVILAGSSFKALQDKDNSYRYETSESNDKNFVLMLSKSNTRTSYTFTRTGEGAMELAASTGFNSSAIKYKKP